MVEDTSICSIYSLLDHVAWLGRVLEHCPTPDNTLSCYGDPAHLSPWIYKLGNV